jgi:hypothetical protein
VTVWVVITVTVRTGAATVRVAPTTVTVLVAPATALVSLGAVGVLPRTVTFRINTRRGGAWVLTKPRRTMRTGLVTVFPGAVTVSLGVVLPANVTMRVLVLESQKARWSRSPTPT